MFFGILLCLCFLYICILTLLEGWTSTPCDEVYGPGQSTTSPWQVEWQSYSGNQILLYSSYFVKVQKYEQRKIGLQFFDMGANNLAEQYGERINILHGRSFEGWSNSAVHGHSLNRPFKPFCLTGWNFSIMFYYIKDFSEKKNTKPSTVLLFLEQTLLACHIKKNWRPILLCYISGLSNSVSLKSEPYT